MQTAEDLILLTAEDYLSAEQDSKLRHEYLGGALYAMAGASEAHNLISGSVYAALRAHLRGKPCRAYMADVKVRLQIANADIFYYPDVMVACDARDTDPLFKRFPTVLVEVLSPETERTDRREKFLNCTQIETLEEYLLIAQDKMEVTVFRRANKWQPELLRRTEQILQVKSIGVSMPLPAIYEDVSLPKE